MGKSLYVHSKHVVELEHIHDVMKNNQEALYDILREAKVDVWSPEGYYEGSDYMEIAVGDFDNFVQQAEQWDESRFHGLDKDMVITALKQIISKRDQNNCVVHLEWL